MGREESKAQLAVYDQAAAAYEETLDDRFSQVAGYHRSQVKQAEYKLDDSRIE